MSACSTEELVLPSAPSAFAGFDRASVFGAPIVLDASLSSDPDGDVLSYSWRLAAQPAGSTARIEDLDARLTQLVPDRLGTYVISLLASDGYLTGRDLVAITVTASAAAPQRPELELSPRAQNVVLSDEPIVIDASAAPNAYFLRTPSGVSTLGRWGGVVVIRGYRGSSTWGGICFGSVIIGDTRIEAAVGNGLFMHEYGHTLQSRAAGPTYLLRYGLPSLISALGPGYHALHPVELDANFRSRRFFSQQPDFRTWPSVAHPVLDGQVALRSAWWEYLPPIFPLYHLGRALRQRMGWARIRAGRP